MLLKGIVINEVSLVDKPANKKKFLLFKREVVEDKKEAVVTKAVVGDGGLKLSRWLGAIGFRVEKAFSESARAPRQE